MPPQYTPENASVSNPLINLDNQLNDISPSVEKLKKDFESLNRPFERVSGEVTKFSNIFKDFKVPFLEHVGSGIQGINSLSHSFQTLAMNGFPAMGKAATMLSGPLGIAAMGVVALATTIVKFYLEMTKTRMEIAQSTAALGDLSGIQEKTNIMYKMASLTVRNWGADIENLNKTMGVLTSAGISPASDEIAMMLLQTTALKTAYQLSGGAMSDTLKLYRQEYNEKDKAIFGMSKLTKGIKDLGISADDSIKKVVGIARSFIDLGIGVSDVDDAFKKTITEMKFGITRSEAYTKEMIGGPLQAGMGQRAWLAQQLNIGGNNPLAGAAMLKYAPEGEFRDKNKNLIPVGEKVIEIGLKELGGITKEEFQKLSKIDKYGYAEMVSKFAEQFGISERTTMEAFSKMGLDIRKPQEDVKEIGKQQLMVATTMSNTLGKLRSITQKISDDLASQKYALIGSGHKIATSGMIISGQGGAAKSINDAELAELLTKKKSIKKHFGGMIGPNDVPRFHNGASEIDAKLLEGESVLNQNATSRLGKNTIDNVNAGGNVGQNDINVYVNIPILKTVIEEAVTRVLRENSHLILVG